MNKPQDISDGWLEVTCEAGVVNIRDGADQIVLNGQEIEMLYKFLKQYLEWRGGE